MTLTKAETQSCVVESMSASAAMWWLVAMLLWLEGGRGLNCDSIGVAFAGSAISDALGDLAGGRGPADRRVLPIA